MIDKEAYITPSYGWLGATFYMQSSSERDFYERIIKSQMFDELVKKRLLPKDQKENMKLYFLKKN